jgi:hypothetical protein
MANSLHMKVLAEGVENLAAGCAPGVPWLPFGSR